MRIRPGRALTLFAAAMALGLAARSDGAAVFVSRHVWTIEDEAFGGWSGLEISANGQGFTAISDRGWITEGAIVRTGSSRIRRIDAGPLRRLDDTADRFFGREPRDAEGLAVAPDGRVFVAYEAVRRVVAYPDASGAAPEVLPIYRDFIRLRPNRSLEALAIGADGALYTLPEGRSRAKAFPVYRFDGTNWASFSAVGNRKDGFVPVGADIGPDGRFYLLERKLLNRVGFAARVRRFDLDPEGLSGERVLLRTRPGMHDNLEGLAVWRDGAGRIRLTMLSDDNFGPLQTTEFVEYLVAE